MKCILPTVRRPRQRQAHHCAALLAASLALPCGADNTLELHPPREVTSIPNVRVIEKRATESGRTFSAAKLSVPARDIPISAEIIDATLVGAMGDMGVALQVASMANVVAAEGGVFNEITLRGFSDAAFYRNGVNDSLVQMPQRSLANIDRIEILKGPSGALYGPGEPGGTINFYTKRPEADPAHAVELGVGSYGEFTLNFDSTGPLAGRDDISYRIVTSREQSRTFRDFVKHDRIFVAPSLSWQPTPQLQIYGSFEYVNNDRLFDSGVAAIDGRFPLPNERFLGEPASGPAQIDGMTLEFSSTLEINPTWQLDLSVQGQKTLLKGDAVEPAELDDDLFLLSRERRYRSETVTALIGQLELSGATTLADRRHHLLFGIEGTDLDEEVTDSTSDSDDAPFEIALFAPIYGSPQPVDLELDRNSHEQRHQVSLYAQDLWEFTDQWRLLVGLRYDYIDQSGFDTVSESSFSADFHKVSPRAGLVFRATPSLSLFASYSQATDPNEGLQPDGKPLQPTDGEAFETGFKWDSTVYPLSIDTSVFYIEQTNVTTEAPGAPSFEIQTAKQQNIGFDFELRSRPLSWLSLQAKYAYVDTEIKDDPVIAEGTRALNVPKHKINILGVSEFSVLRTSDFTVGVALGYTSNQQGSLDEDELGLRLPAYFRGDVFAAFDYSDNIGLRLQIRNFTDEKYLQSSQSDALRLTPGEPISVHAQLEYSF